MARINSKFINFGTGAGQVNAQQLPATNTATNYTPTQVASEGTAQVSAHLNGINSALGNSFVSGDIALTSFTAANNQASAANVTGLAFANGTVRAFTSIVSITRGATYASYTLEGIQKASSWDLNQNYVGDVTGITFTITSAGQIQYTSTNTGSTATIKFRAWVTTV
jgi:hypothetical protein